MYLRSPTVHDFAKIFKGKHQTFTTDGTQEGTIVKFHDFYLKIYNGKSRGTFVVKGYRYYADTPMFVDEVPMSQMREYASRF